MTDVFHHCAAVKADQRPGLPLYLYGHSMGGMVATAAVTRNSAFFAGLLLEVTQLSHSTSFILPFLLCIYDIILYLMQGPLIVPDPNEVILLILRCRCIGLSVR